jgi:hypothetical protein
LLRFEVLIVEYLQDLRSTLKPRAAVDFFAGKHSGFWNTQQPVWLLVGVSYFTCPQFSTGSLLSTTISRKRGKTCMDVLSPTVAAIEQSTLSCFTPVANAKVQPQASDVDSQVYIQPVLPSPEFEALVKPQVTVVIRHKDQIYGVEIRHTDGNPPKIGKTRCQTPTVVGVSL